MATTTFSPRETVDGQDRGNSVTRRGFLRWAGSVATAGALAAVGANGLSEPTHAKRHGKKRRKQHTDRPQPATKSASEALALESDLTDNDLAYGGRCQWQIVCYPGGWCRRRRVCW